MKPDHYDDWLIRSARHLPRKGNGDVWFAMITGCATGIWLAGNFLGWW